MQKARPTQAQDEVLSRKQPKRQSSTPNVQRLDTSSVPGSQQAVLQFQRQVGNQATLQMMQKKNDGGERAASAGAHGHWRKTSIPTPAQSQTTDETGLGSDAVIQRAWNEMDSDEVARLNNSAYINRLTELIDRVGSIPLRAKTIVPKTGSTNIRIDMQGGAPRGEETWANIQCQVGEDSVAGVICPFDLDIAVVRAGLHEALAANDMLEWQSDEEETDEDEGLPEDWVENETKDAPIINLPPGSRLPY